MIINTNLASMNTLRQMGVNESSTQKALAKLSSGLKINSAADDAAGLSISEKMRGQISGLNKATSNAQDGISMVSTAEGSLSETTSILQRMRELAVQASSDTNTSIDRGAMQTEMNQLTSEVNRIGNTTSFNTQKLLQGDGKANLAATGIANITGDLSSRTITKGQASQTTTVGVAAAGNSVVFNLSGVNLTVGFTASGGGTATGVLDNFAYGVTSTTANVSIDGTPTAAEAGTGAVDALNKMIAANSTLKGNYIATSGAAGEVQIAAVAGGRFDGAAGSIGASTPTGITATDSLTVAGTDTANGTVGKDAVSTQASNGSTISGAVAGIANNNNISVDINGITLTATFKAYDSTKGAAGEVFDASNGTTASINQVGSTDTDSKYTSTAAGIKAVATNTAAAFQAMIDNNSTLKGQFAATVTGGDTVTITAVKGGTSDGSGSVSAFTGTLSGGAASAGTASVGTFTAAVVASKEINLAAYATKADVQTLVGKGMTVNGTEVQFYDASKGAYTGSAKGIDISSATSPATLAATLATQLGTVSGVAASSNAGTLTISSATAGAAGNNLKLSDGGVQENFQAKLQIGANSGESLTVDIKDMRSQALDISGTSAGATITASNGSKATLTAVQSASDGTSNTNTEYTLDLSTAANATAAISVIDDATAKVSAERSKLGAVQNRLEHTINNLGTSSQNVTTAEANIRDVDMAREMTNFTKNNILQQASQAMLSQANQQAQGVLQLLR